MNILILITCVASINCQTSVKLGSFSVDQTRITLSGFSSGGTFAQQLQFSYSSRFLGIAVFSHNFYRCGTGNGKLDDYDRVCTKLSDLKETEYYNPNLVHRDISQYRRNNQIEDPSQLRNKRLYVYTGLRNILFTPGQSLNILNVYEPYIRNPSCIRTRVQDANLVLPTNNNKFGSCTGIIPQNSFIANCGFSGAFDALSFLLQDKVIREPVVGRTIRLESLQTFDQAEFYKGINNHQMDTHGYLYVPSKCRNSFGARCLLHFYFHGCLTGREFNGTRHIQNSGFLEVAELNDIIMIFPQALSSLPENEIGCWDTFGISGSLYATKEGAQVKVIKNMLDKILGGGSMSHLLPEGIYDNAYQTSQYYWGAGSSDSSRI